ncbi:MAG TPA: hypothetical protein ENK18_23025 [Deltaproteobacteria bacterium]|nr:hypothetical protein [Deltaproteobacteria bacterium]
MARWPDGLMGPMGPMARWPDEPGGCSSGPSQRAPAGHRWFCGPPLVLRATAGPTPPRAPRHRGPHGIAPSAAARPDALPPDRQIPWIAAARCPGINTPSSRAPVAEPGTQDAARAPASNTSAVTLVCTSLVW